MGVLTTCRVCGGEFPLSVKYYYVARDIEKKGLVPTISGQEAMQYDAFDCPYCGCQNIMQERKLALEATISAENEESDPECDKEEPDEEEKPDLSDAEMREYLSDYCHHHWCNDCPLIGSEFKCGRGYSFSSPTDFSGYMTPEEIKVHYEALREAIK